MRSHVSLALALALSAAGLALAKGTNDFRVYYKTSERVRAAEPIYRLEDGRDPFKYTPPVAIVVAPLSLMPFPAAAVAWNVLNAIGLALFLALLARGASALAGASTPGWPSWLAVAAVGPLVHHLFSMGQIEGLIFALMAGFLACEDERPWLAAFALALAAAIKPPFVLVALLWLWPGRWRSLRHLVIAGSSVAVAPVLAWGPWRLLDEWLNWRRLLAATTPPLMCRPANQSVWGLLCRGAGVAPEHLPLAVAFVGALFVGLGWLLARHVRRELGPGWARLVSFGWLLYGTAFLSPLGWRTNFIATVALLQTALFAALFVPAARSLRPIAVVFAVALAGAQLALARDLIGRPLFAEVERYGHFGWIALVTVAASSGILIAASFLSRRQTGSLAPQSVVSAR